MVFLQQRLYSRIWHEDTPSLSSSIHTVDLIRNYDYVLHYLALSSHLTLDHLICLGFRSVQIKFRGNIDGSYDVTSHHHLTNHNDSRSNLTIFYSQHKHIMWDHKYQHKFDCRAYLSINLSIPSHIRWIITSHEIRFTLASFMSLSCVFILL
jgi:hypothetical protein